LDLDALDAFGVEDGARGGGAGQATPAADLRGAPIGGADFRLRPEPQQESGHDEEQQSRIEEPQHLWEQRGKERRYFRRPMGHSPSLPPGPRMPVARNCVPAIRARTGPPKSSQVPGSLPWIAWWRAQSIASARRSS